MKKTIAHTLALFALLCTIVAETQAQSTGMYPQAESEKSFPNLKALNVHVGSTGFGLHFYQPIGSHFGARLGASFMPFKTDIQGTYSGRGTTTDIGIQAHNAHLIFGYNPFSQGEGFFKSFGLNVGGAYFFALKGNLTTRLSDPYQYGDLLIDPVNVGAIHTTVDYKKFNPYAGIGWSKIRLSDVVSLSLDIGTYYLSKPSVAITGTQMLQGNENNAAIVERNVENYRWLPRVELGISYTMWP